jgi:hypothetical protein
MEKSIAELRADKAELEARIAEAKRKEKRVKACEALRKWVDKYEASLTDNEVQDVVGVVASLDPNPLLGAKP